MTRVSKQSKPGERTVLQWDDFKNHTPDDAAKKIYQYIDETAETLIGWYWAAIKAKKKWALWTRSAAIVALIAGTVTQIYGGSIDPPGLRLHYTQGSLALLTTAGLLILGDRSLGWTSGWTRYVTTVMKMETLTSAFKLTWAATQLAREAPPTRDDVVKLFDLARELETALFKARDEETLSWAAEFNAGLQLLETALKAQRETTEKKLDELQAVVDKKHSDAEQQARASQDASKPGAVEVSLKFKTAPARVKIRFDKDAPEELFGASWAKLAVSPGQHHLEILSTTDDRILEARIVDVTPGQTTRQVIEFAE